MFASSALERAAARVLSLINSPFAENFVHPDGYPRWEPVLDNCPMLSSGEQALVALAQHVSGRVPASPNRSFVLALSRVDAANQHAVANVVLELFAGADLIDVL